MNINQERLTKRRKNPFYFNGFFALSVDLSRLAPFKIQNLTSPTISKGTFEIFLVPSFFSLERKSLNAKSRSKNKIDKKRTNIRVGVRYLTFTFVWGWELMFEATFPLALHYKFWPLATKNKISCLSFENFHFRVRNVDPEVFISFSLVFEN